MSKAFIVLAKPDGSLDMTETQHAIFRGFIREHNGKKLRVTVEKLTPESRRQRGFYHGAVLPLWAYLDGNDYRSSELMAQYHEYAKAEFLPEILTIAGKAVKLGSSSKGKLNVLIERLIEYLEESYGIDPAKVLNVELYKKFRDTVYPFAVKYDTFIDYMVDLKLL